jgi:Cap4 SAVED domain
VERDIALPNCKVTLHCHCLTVDATGRVKIARLAEFMRAMLADYAIPKNKLSAARQRDIKFRSSGAVSRLHHEAINLFTDLKNTGEGGEMLLYLLAERFLKMPQVLCKMDLKTDSSMHYHGADGVYARVTEDGIIKLYWGESKIYGNVTDAIRDCLNSLTPFLLEPDSEGAGRERDLLLLSDKADLDDDALTSAFRKYFDKTSPLSNRVQYCGIALVGFDADFYPEEHTPTRIEVMAEAATAAISKWSLSVENRIKIEKLESFEIEFLCVPMPSVQAFRDAFLAALGKTT